MRIFTVFHESNYAPFYLPQIFIFLLKNVPYSNFSCRNETSSKYCCSVHELQLACKHITQRKPVLQFHIAAYFNNMDFYSVFFFIEPARLMHYFTCSNFRFKAIMRYSSSVSIHNLSMGEFF